MNRLKRLAADRDRALAPAQEEAPALAEEGEQVPAAE
jgi:hypothetical protein